MVYTVIFLLTKYQLSKRKEIPCNACLQFIRVVFTLKVEGRVQLLTLKGPFTKFCFTITIFQLGS